MYELAKAFAAAAAVWGLLDDAETFTMSVVSTVPTCVAEADGGLGIVLATMLEMDALSMTWMTSATLTSDTVGFTELPDWLRRLDTLGRSSTVAVAVYVLEETTQ